MKTKRAGKPKGWHDARYRELIEALVAERKRQKLSQEALASRMGWQQHFISRVETGERLLDVAEFADVAVALGLNPSELISQLWRL